MLPRHQRTPEVSGFIMIRKFVAGVGYRINASLLICQENTQTVEYLTSWC